MFFLKFFFVRLIFGFSNFLKRLRCFIKHFNAETWNECRCVDQRNRYFSLVLSYAQGLNIKNDKIIYPVHIFVNENVCGKERTHPIKGF